MRLQIEDTPRPYVMGHRGNLVRCPENTLASFRRAVDDGADLVETDVHVSADGHFICIHDATVDRTTDGSGAVAEMTLAQLKELSASCGRADFAEERVPTLAEMFEVIPQRVIVALELKTDALLEPRVARRFVEAIDACGRCERVVLISFNDARVRAVAREAAKLGYEIPTGYISYKRFVPKSGVELLGPVWPLLVINPLFVAMAHLRGQLVCPLDPTPDSRLWFYKLLGCDAVLSDDPAATLRALGR